jgi:perosamine synthetase
MMGDKNYRYPWWRPEFGSLECERAVEGIKNNFPNEGELTREFEEVVATAVGAKFAVAVTSGTVAIFLGLRAVDVGFGDEVIVPSFSFIATANAVHLCGAKPVLVDISPDTLGICPNAIRNAITSKTKAIVPVHVSGRPVDLGTILEIAKTEGLFVIEDAAEAFMSKHNGKALGTFGAVGCYSLSPNKIITTGQGGILVTDDSDIYQKLIQLKDQGRPMRGTGGDDLHVSVGFNFKFTDMQAGLGLAQMTRVPERVDRLRRNHHLYKASLIQSSDLSLHPFNLEDGNVPLWTDVQVRSREQLIESLDLQGIECRRFWHPIDSQIPYKNLAGRCDTAKKISKNGMWFPSSFMLRDEDIYLIADTVNKSLERLSSSSA